MEKYIRAGNSRTYTGRPHPHHDKLSDASILVITTAGMPEAACVIVATSMDDMALRVTVGTTETKAPGARTNPATVNTACAAGADNNSIAITMGR